MDLLNKLKSMLGEDTTPENRSETATDVKSCNCTEGDCKCEDHENCNCENGNCDSKDCKCNNKDTEVEDHHD